MRIDEEKDEEKVVLDIDEIYSIESGKYFIAGKRCHTDFRAILDEICPDKYKVKTKWGGEYRFTKIVNGHINKITDPIFDKHKGLLNVNSFNQYELERAVKVFQHPNWKGSSPVTKSTIECINLFIYMYENYGTDMFEMLSKYMHFCTVIYDYRKQCLIGGVSEPNNEFNNLFYGNSIDRNDILFSNNPDILRRYCYEVFKMPNNTYMVNGELYSFKDKNDEIETKLKEILESEYGKKLIKELVTQEVNEYLSESDEIVRKLK